MSISSRSASGAPKIAMFEILQRTEIGKQIILAIGSVAAGRTESAASDIFIHAKLYACRMQVELIVNNGIIMQT